MTKVNMHKAKTHFSKLVDQALQGEDVIIARNGKPLVRLVPVEGEAALRPIGLDRQNVDQGFLEESMRPLEDEELAVFYAPDAPGG